MTSQIILKSNDLTGREKVKPDLSKRSQKVKADVCYSMTKLAMSRAESLMNYINRAKTRREEIDRMLKDDSIKKKSLERLAQYRSKLNARMDDLKEDTDQLRSKLEDAEQRMEGLNSRVRDMTIDVINMETDSGIGTPTAFQYDNLMPGLRKFQEGIEDKLEA